MTRYIFEYKVIPEDTGGEFSHTAHTEEEARKKVRERIADLEFVELHEILVGNVIKALAPNENGSYFECEGCT